MTHFVLFSVNWYLIGATAASSAAARLHVLLFAIAEPGGQPPVPIGPNVKFAAHAIRIKARTGPSPARTVAVAHERPCARVRARTPSLALIITHTQRRHTRARAQAQAETQDRRARAPFEMGCVCDG